MDDRSALLPDAADRDGLADALVVNPDGVWVRPNDGKGFFPASGQTNWTGGEPAGGVKGTQFVDVTGDGRADLVTVDDDGLFVRPSDGQSFLAGRFWLSGPFWGNWGTYFADVDGDGRADAIVVNDTAGVFVALSNGSDFILDKTWWPHNLHSLNTREPRNYFADVTGAENDHHRRADLIAINGDGITVCPARTDGTFSDNCRNWTGGAEFRGARGVFFADVNGDGRDDAIAIDSSNGTNASLRVRLSTRTSFGQEKTLVTNFVPERGVSFANVIGSAALDLVYVKESGVVVQNLSPVANGFNATSGAFYGLR